MNTEEEYKDKFSSIGEPQVSAKIEQIEPLIIKPRAYLAQFYQRDLDLGDKALLHFYAQVYKDLQGRSFLEFGGGPTIYSLITAARTASCIHFTDYSNECMSEVSKWLIEDRSAFDWTEYTSYALYCENGSTMRPSQIDILNRHNLIRQRIRVITRCDASAVDPLLGSFLGPYGVVANSFCLDALTKDRDVWFRLNQKIANLVEKDGFFVTVYLLNATYWTFQGIKRPAITLTLTDVIDMYSSIGLGITHKETVQLNRKGYDGFIMVCGQKS
jgi:hypothetical protein